ncbi:hypothetical protein A2276_08685 [candidate division WOR-1 bacterium RIFOXYA12_FULL_43_27]|uniref:DNA methylase N-4/N-6 domain-containing protein n=1 Tax=candidate division WOR-1 bacterium RIFOXYC2_FULL_46_14 TaxID=1802587 RepID=A0A1F4U2Y5_UNCSA|nr:MAG: hypothetical protein A2276_08685 [candidate division WOR-1 bacterium RIFOXYA12_FULL_43_27]OGC19727.1 MAG: hypothetical protein A2292_08550 [candidate division WOR-1 bacterium RIFOXYB2_FULL_46_45]OGC30676.1 MAG: hypothetical protein A2232_02875 [candidate division WOR-1 bacterium RIFOXYA2_FULL_46_56]OGC39227.1 MAG: hypothetical protein A2438_07590 [candidate division WOR-1 bacterium RIFOXYC2_FULL_46_14]
MNKPKLELTWIGKNNPEYDIANIEPRILEENPKLSNCANDPNTENMIIHGDNLLALKALLPEYEGRVKCIYIDPPYNTGNAFEHYDDSVEHSTWLSLMRPRLELLKMLLRDDGVIFAQIDDNEMAYLTIIMDDIFGRENRINIICVKMSEATGVKMSHADKRFPKLKEFILFYKKDVSPEIKPVKIRSGKWNNEYKEILCGIDKNTLNEIKLLMDENKSNAINLSKVNSFLKDTKIKTLAKYFKEENVAESEQDSFKWNNSWRIIQAVGAGSIKERAKQAVIEGQDISVVLSARNKLYLFKSEFDNYSKDPRIRIIFADKYLEYNPGDFWTDIKTSGGIGQEGGVFFPQGKKPEALIYRILNSTTRQNDLVLDSFLGSGTTAAVAHKMGRKYIGLEMGEHAYTHCKVRLDKVIDGTDQGGISKTVEWKGGGAYKFYELAPSFIVKDEFGNPVIDGFYNDTKLIKAMCKLMNFTYKPSQTEYWKHGVGQGKNYLYVTTQLLTSAMIQQIAGHLAEGESLIISPKKYEPGADKIDSRITIKKIPQSVLKACHFGKKEYLLPIKESALEEIEIEEDND